MSEGNFDIGIPYQKQTPGQLHPIFPNRYEGEDGSQISADYIASVHETSIGTDERAKENPALYVLEEISGRLQANVDDVAEQSAEFDVVVDFNEEHADDLRRAASALDSVESEGSRDVTGSYIVLNQETEGLVGETTLQELQERGVQARFRLSRKVPTHLEEDVSESVEYNVGNRSFEYLVRDKSQSARKEVERANSDSFRTDKEVDAIKDRELEVRENEVAEALRDAGLKVE